jgi:hypothetical protein
MPGIVSLAQAAGYQGLYIDFPAQCLDWRKLPIFPGQLAGLTDVITAYSNHGHRLIREDHWLSRGWGVMLADVPAPNNRGNLTQPCTTYTGGGEGLWGQ